jgi:hypothetical protein
MLGCTQSHALTISSTNQILIQSLKTRFINEYWAKQHGAAEKANTAAALKDKTTEQPAIQ